MGIDTIAVIDINCSKRKWIADALFLSLAELLGSLPQCFFLKIYTFCVTECFCWRTAVRDYKRGRDKLFTCRYRQHVVNTIRLHVLFITIIGFAGWVSQNAHKIRMYGNAQPHGYRRCFATDGISFCDKMRKSLLTMTLFPRKFPLLDIFLRFYKVSLDISPLPVNSLDKRSLSSMGSTYDWRSANISELHKQFSWELIRELQCHLINNVLRQITAVKTLVTARFMTHRPYQPLDALL